MGVINASGGKVILDGSLIHTNKANRSGHGVGGGIVNTGKIYIKSGSIDHNFASADGGGIFNTHNGRVIGNTALVHDNVVNGIPNDIYSEAQS